MHVRFSFVFVCCYYLLITPSNKKIAFAPNLLTLFSYNVTECIVYFIPVLRTFLFCTAIANS